MGVVWFRKPMYSMNTRNCGPSSLSAIIKWYVTLVVLSLFSFLVLRYGLMGRPLTKRMLRAAFFNSSVDPLYGNRNRVSHAIQFPQNDTLIVLANNSIPGDFVSLNLSMEELSSLQCWKRMNDIINQTSTLPHAKRAIKEGSLAWKRLMDSVQEEKYPSVNESTQMEAKVKQCPYSIGKMNSSEISDDNGYKLRIPCGMVQGSSITVIGAPVGLLGNFQFDLRGMMLPGELNSTVILHYSVRLHGDKLTEDPVIIQNTWTAAQGWGAEERCPSSDSKTSRKANDLGKCSIFVGEDDKQSGLSGKYHNGLRVSPKTKGSERNYFPFRKGCLAVSTLRVGEREIQMIVNGNQITSFPYRESLEPWLVSEIRILGDIKVISILASGLPTSEDIDHTIDLEALRSPPLPLHKHLVLFVGIFSSANNSKQRMAIRRTWFQYEAVRSGVVAARFFVGLKKNQMVNSELWSEAQTYGDIQLMPFVDYYSLVIWKTIAICTYATNVVSADYIMKTDDDSFVRLDEVILSLKRINTTHGLLYGHIDKDSQPERSIDKNWYISTKEWPDETYPPWAHGTGYVVSHDIAHYVYRQHQETLLRMFKLEDVAMGIWIADMNKMGKKVNYVNEDRIHFAGCKTGYVIAHYQRPKDMLCLWQKLQDTHLATCCEDR